MKSEGMLYMLALLLVVVGGLSWGLVGLFDYDLVATLFGDMSTLARVVYALVGLGAVWVALVWVSETMNKK
ncbi:MAG: DUF378 domain-containing protein [Candidatus Dojkabacteria bacterium]